MTRALLKRQIAKQYGVSEETVEYYAKRLPKDWQIGDRIELEPDPHTHQWPQGVSVINDDETGVTLTFAHLGDGDFPGQSEPLQTSYAMVNNTRRPASGTIHFFDDNGDPLEMEIDGVTDSSFPFNLPRGTVQRMTTSGAGDLKSGWARIRSDQPIVVTSNFGAIRANGSVIVDVGVGESELGTEFTIFADTIGSNDTGVAATNPSDTQAIDIEMTLRNAAGAVVDQEMLNLPPRGHIARFLGQLFPGVAGIDEFEGTVVLRSTTAVVAAGHATQGWPAGEAPMLEFAGLTLRISGTVFTSVPMVRPVPADAEFTKLAFPQAADGELGDFKVSTTPVIFNTSDEAASGVIEFFKGDGTPNNVRVNGESTTSIVFNISPRGVFRIDTDGVGPIAVGWARVTMDRPLAGVVIFTIKDATDQIVAAVGVPSAFLRQNLELLADTTGLFNTAIALVNPLDEETPQGSAPTRVNLTLLDNQGSYVAGASVELGLREHSAIFLTEVFSDVDGISEFQGRLQASVSGEEDYVLALSLRSAQEKLTSVPVFAQQHAFAPSALFRPTHTLIGEEAGLSFVLRQSEHDLSLETAQIRASGLRMAAEIPSVGERLAAGAFLSRASRTALLITTGVEGEQPAGTGGRSLTFDLVSDKFQGIFRQARGTLQETPDGVQIDLVFENDTPVTFVAEDADTRLISLTPILGILTGTSQITVESEFRSVSRRRSVERRVVHKRRQVIPTVVPSLDLPNMTALSSYLLIGGESLIIEGDNFGDEPTVVFPLFAGAPPDGSGGVIEVSAFVQEDGTAVVGVPSGVTHGALRINNQTGLGNEHLFDVLFAPHFEMLSEATGETPAQNGTGMETVFSIEEGPDQLALDAFSVRIQGQILEADNLEVGMVVGSISSDENLVVAAIDEDEVTLEIVPFGSDFSGTVVLKGPSELDLLSLDFEPEDRGLEADYLQRGQRREMRLTDLILGLPEAGEIAIGTAVLESVPGGAGGQSAIVGAGSSSAFVQE